MTTDPLTDVVGRARKNESGSNSSCDGEVVGLIVRVETVDGSKERKNGRFDGVWSLKMRVNASFSLLEL